MELDADGNKLLQKMRLGETQKVKKVLNLCLLLIFRLGLARASTVSLLVGESPPRSVPSTGSRTR